MDVTKAGLMAANAMEWIAKDYEDKEGWEIGMMINIVQINGPNGEIENRVQNNADAPFEALGLLRVAEHIIVSGN